jgi:hypothetical protein
MPSYTNGNSTDTVAQRWAKIAVNAGFSIVAAAFLIWFFVTKVDTKMDAMATDHASIKSEIQTIKTQNDTMIDQLWLLISVQQSTCINVAKTAQERTSCVQVVSRPR